MHRAVIMVITGHRCLLRGKRGRKAEAPCFTPDSSRGQATCARQFSKYKVFYLFKKSTGLSGAFPFPISLLQYKQSLVRYYPYPDE